MSRAPDEFRGPATSGAHLPSTPARLGSERAGPDVWEQEEAVARMILVADDGSDHRDAIGFWLRRAGFDVLEASTPSELETRISDRPDVIVLDTELPGRSGFELANRLKRDPSTAGIPIIHVAPGFTTGEWRAQGLEAG